MKYLAVVFIVFFSFATAGENESSVESIVDKLQRSYNAITTFQAQFEQTYRSIRFDPKKTKGSVVISKPGKMRWDYKEPKGRVLVADGKHITLYDPEDQQALIFPQPKDGGLPVAFSFLMGKTKLTDKFHIKKMKEEKQHKSNHVILRCRPKEPEPNLKEIFFTIRLGDPTLVVATRVIDALDGENEIRFSKIRTNKKIKDRRFIFHPPKGVAVVAMSESINIP